MKRKTLTKLIVGIPSIFLAGMLHAAPMIFTGTDNVGPGDARPNADTAYGDFITALGGATTNVVDFEGGNNGDFSFSGNFESTGTFASGVVSNDTKDLGYNTTAGGDSHLRVTPGGFGDWGSLSLTLNYASGINAWGGFFTGLETGAGGYSGFLTLSYTDGSTTEIAIPESPTGGGVTFLGFLDHTALFNGITITETSDSDGGRDVWGLDDITTANVPEPSVLFLMSAGLFGMSLASRRRIRKA